MRNDGTLAVIDTTGAVLYQTSLQPLANGLYTIQSVGTAAELPTTPACGTYLGYPACGGGVAISSLLATNPALVTWSVTRVPGSTPPVYTIQAATMEGCGQASYLGSLPCSTGSNEVALVATNDGTGSQVRSQFQNPCEFTPRRDVNRYFAYAQRFAI